MPTVKLSVENLAFSCFSIETESVATKEQLGRRKKDFNTGCREIVSKQLGFLDV